MKSILNITVCYILLISQVLFSQPDWEPGFILTDSVHSLKIKTCMLTPFESFTDFPLININSSERLLLQFDDFNFDSEDYMYLITHCNSDWSVSDLHFTEYIDGFVGERLAIVGDIICVLKKEYLQFSTGFISPQYWKIYQG